MNTLKSIKFKQSLLKYHIPDKESGKSRAAYSREAQSKKWGRGNVREEIPISGNGVKLN